MTFLHTARLVGRKLGLEIQRAGPQTLPMVRLAKLLDHHGIATILDVGANDGGYASAMFEAGYSGRVISFEPLPDAHRALVERARSGRNDWFVAPRVALSSSDGTSAFHVAGNSVSSSLLEMTETHTEAAPASGEIASIEVTTARLDTIWNDLDVKGVPFLKLDVQGAEQMVLAGGSGALASSIVGIQLEMSLTPLYSGQPTFRELDSYLVAHGFECWDLLPGFRAPNTHRLLQYDGVYFRTTETKS